MTTLTAVRKTLAFHLAQPLVRVLSRTGVTPSMITWLGLGVAIGAAALAASGHLFAAGFVVLASGFLDIIDGALARGTGRATRFGAVLDSTLDRAAEAVVLLGLLLYYTGQQSTAGVAIVGVVWLMSLLVSYIRARAEAIGVDCQVGVFTRAERVVIMALGLLLSQFGDALLVALSVIAVLSFFTVVHRLRHVWRQTREG